jgi:type I restriction enzyme S subunit
VSHQNVHLKDLLVATKDGDWGEAEAKAGLLEYNVIRGTDFDRLRRGDVSTVPVRHLSEKTVGRRTLETNDILIETAGGTSDRPTGRSVLITDRLLKSLGRPSTCASFARFLRVNPELADARYIFWWLQNLYEQGMMRQHEVRHTGVGRFQYTRFAESEPVPLPSINDQRWIAETLGALDEKIASNLQAARLQEQIVQELFRAWFVRFEPWGRSCPSSWRRGRLADVLALVRTPVKAGTRPELPYVPIDMIPFRSVGLDEYRPNEEARSSLILFEKNDILIGAMRVYFHRVALAPFDGITRSTTFVLRPVADHLREYALLLCNEDQTIEFARAHSKGTTMPYAVWDGGLAELPAVLPPSEVAEEFSGIVGSIIDRLRDGLFENLRLAALRDGLLSELFSGRLGVPKGSPVLEEVPR